MGNLIVFLGSNRFTGCFCNPDMTPEEAVDLIRSLPPEAFLVMCV